MASKKFWLGILILVFVMTFVGYGESPITPGTYYFYPRIQATKGGVPVTNSYGYGAYIDRIVVSGNYFTVYIINVPEGKYAKGGGMPSNDWRGTAERYILLKDLDTPRKTWNLVNTGDDPVTGGVFNTFEGVTARRFSLSNSYNYDDSPPVVFEVLMPDQPDE